MTSLTIGQVARQAAVGVETIRYYERLGLIAPPKRRPSGYRAFSAGAVRRLRFIRRAKDLGFSLKEVSELLELRFDSIGSCAEVRARAGQKITDIKARIDDLERIKGILEHLASSCPGEGPTAACPILDALDPPDTPDE